MRRAIAFEDLFGGKEARFLRCEPGSCQPTAKCNCILGLADAIPGSMAEDRGVGWILWFVYGLVV